jgi:hypothetical protein
MTDDEILLKAIQKAVDSGLPGLPEINRIDYYDGVMRLEHDGHNSWLSIFNHDFARALWGEKWLKSTGPGLGEYEANDGWKHHLQNMVIADDPIKYLGDNI